MSTVPLHEVQARLLPCMLRSEMLNPACAGWQCSGAAKSAQARPRSERASDVGYCVGWCCASRSSLSMCIRVVLPALSRPRNRILAFLFAAQAGHAAAR